MKEQKNKRTKEQNNERTKEQKKKKKKEKRTKEQKKKRNKKQETRNKKQETRNKKQEIIKKKTQSSIPSSPLQVSLSSLPTHDLHNKTSTRIAFINNNTARRVGELSLLIPSIDDDSIRYYIYSKITPTTLI
jgi:hypothetical protein